MATKIEVEWIAQSQSMTQALERMNAKLDAQDKKLEKIGKTSAQAATAAAGSFAALEKELKDAERALQHMSASAEGFAQQRNKVDMLRNSVRNAKDAMNQPTTMAGSLADIKAGFDIASQAATSFVAMLDKVQKSQEAVIETSSQIGVEIDTMARKLQVQMGFTDEQRKAETNATLEAAKTAGVTPDVAFATQTQLASSGFDTDALDTMIKAMQATNFEGRPDELVQGIAQTLNAYQLERTDANAKSLANALAGLFKSTDLQMVDMGDFAKNASVFEAAGLNISEALAGFTSLREIMPGAEAATGLRNVVSILQTAGGKKTQTDALESAGISPEEVDFVGENLTQVIDRLRQGMDSLPQEKRQVAMGELFGRENFAAATAILERSDRIKELEAMQNDTAILEHDSAIKRSSQQADINRMEIERIQGQQKNDEAIHEKKLQILDRENFIADTVESGVAGGGIIGALAPFAGFNARTADMLPGIETESTGRGVGASLLAALRDLSSVFGDSMVVQNRMIESLERRNGLEQGSLRIRPQAPARPQSAPLPSTTVP